MSKKLQCKKQGNRFSVQRGTRTRTRIVYEKSTKLNVELICRIALKNYKLVVLVLTLRASASEKGTFRPEG